MSEQLQLRRGSASQVALFTGAQGELAVDTTNNVIRVQDGATAGGWQVAMANRTAVSDAAYSALVTDRIIAFTALTAARAVALPAASSYPQGHQITVVDESGSCSSTFTITINRAGSDTIHGGAATGTALVLSAPYSFATLESNGSNGWTALGQGGSNAVFSGAAPTLSAGQVSISGAAPTFGANNEGGISVSSTRGLVLGGKGSVSDVMIVNDAQAAVLTIATGTQTATLTGNLVMDGEIALATGTSGGPPPLLFTAGANLTSPAAGAWEYDGNAFYSTVNNGRGVVPSEQAIRQTTGYTLTSQTAAQQLFDTTANGAVTLPAGTYFFECIFTLSSMSATSGTFGFALGGSASLGTMLWEARAAMTATPATAVTPSVTMNTNLANTALTANSTAAAGYAAIRGLMRVNTAGTVIPQVSLSVAAAAIVANNSHFRITPFGSLSVGSVGNWS